MGSGKKAPQIKLSERQRKILERYHNKRNISRQYYQRIDIILQAFKGRQNLQISQSLSIHFNTVSKWRKRWAKSYGHLCEYEKGASSEGVSDSELLQKMLAILTDEPRSGPPIRISLTEKQQLVALACKKPEDFGVPLTQWNREMLAKVAMAEGIVEKISPRYVSEILKKA